MDERGRCRAQSKVGGAPRAGESQACRVARENRPGRASRTFPAVSCPRRGPDVTTGYGRDVAAIPASHSTPSSQGTLQHVWIRSPRHAGQVPRMWGRVICQGWLTVPASQTSARPAAITSHGHRRRRPHGPSGRWSSRLRWVIRWSPARRSPRGRSPAACRRGR